MTVNTFVLRLLKAWIARRIVASIGPELPEAPFIVTANHTSYFDHFVIAFWLLSQGRAYPRFLSKSELFEQPISAWFNRLGGGIPVARDKVDAEAFARAKEVLDDGGIFIMYAEGTRSPDGWLRAPRRGIASLAAEAGVPVVPVGLFGTNQVQPIGSKWPRRKRRIVIHNAAPVAAPRDDRKTKQEYAREVFEVIAALTAQWPSFVGTPDFRTPPLSPALSERAAAAHALVERGFGTSGQRAVMHFQEAWRLTRGSRDPYVLLEGGRAVGQLALHTSNPFKQLSYALQSRRAIWKSVRRVPDYPLAWHVWASLLEQLPSWLGGDELAAQTGHRVAISIDPYWSRAVMHAALTYRKYDRPSEAERWLQHLIQLPVKEPGDAARLDRARELQADWQLGNA
ncbi:1-acyl-sn-glycerol-3-phosphate acyltransferase [Diaminobutyricibacter sp. McL0618]|uniref:lysophospholipid acyltransferase family protein n=1 Tax=Leifsonia sp. McL0618 TaxID=3415677 RepID=UPI003CEA8F60